MVTLLGYLLIAAALIVATCAIGVILSVVFPVIDAWQYHHSVSKEGLWRWFFFSVNTGLLFGVLIKLHKQSRRSSVFWAALVISFAVHFAAYWEIFKVIPQWRPIWWVWTLPMEATPIELGLRWANGHFKRRGRHRHPSTSSAPDPDTPAPRTGPV
jgi:hypothetical protein